MRPSHEESTWETIRRLALGRELDTSCDALHRGLRVTCGSSAGSAHSVGTHPMHRRPFGTDIAKARSSSRRLVMDFGGSREVLLHLPHRPWLHYVRRGLDGCSAEIHVDDPPEARREPSGPRVCVCTSILPGLVPPWGFGGRSVTAKTLDSIASGLQNCL